jgi:hypothetical protein
MSHRGWITIQLAALSAGLLLLFCLDPATAGVFPPCPFHALTGWFCPGCGSLRAIHALTRGHLQAAIAFNPLMVLSLPVLALLRLRTAWLYSPRIAWTAATLLVSYGILRNLPFWPFSALSPHG